MVCVRSVSYTHLEGDGEEILIPALVKKVLGVSLDEMGIGPVSYTHLSMKGLFQKQTGSWHIKNGKKQV